MSNYNPVELILAKRRGQTLSPGEITQFIRGFMAGRIPDYQMSALLMAIYFQGLEASEIAALTKSYIDSGSSLSFPDALLVADKHSTGGVGDKISLMLAPIAAALGLSVPMISGRGLGHTGGTLDKLESIPGFRVDYTPEEYKQQLREIGLCFIGQTDRLAPADGRLFSLRDVTGTVESIPLIASSVMSKKLAEGLDALVLDVKVGSGAFIKRQVDARRLAQMMVGIGRRVDKRVQALITDMNQPLGFAVGNALEVMEASQTLQNAGPPDLTRLSLELAARMIYLGQKAASLEEARRTAEHALVDGSGYRKLKEAIQAQGGNPQSLDKFELLPNATGVREVASPRAGYVSVIDAAYIGHAANMIGAGRDHRDAVIDPAVGVILEVKVGEKVEAGSVLCRLYYTNQERVEEAAGLVEDAFRISAQRPEDRELILEVVS